MEKKFKDVEQEFNQLKQKYRQKKISGREFKDKLKKIRLEDKKGRCWTIGAQTGKWYYFDGKKWAQSKPPSIQEKKAICIYCGFENDLENETCAYCGGSLGGDVSVCPKCGHKLDDPSQPCPYCTVERKTWEKAEEEEEEEEEEEFKDERDFNFIFRFISPVSFLFFTGGLGLIIGIIIGAFTGATDYFSGIVKIIPDFLQKLHGNLIGGIFYGLLGGVFGFIFLGLLGFFCALLMNIILSFIGGIKVRVDKIR